MKNLSYTEEKFTEEEKDANQISNRVFKGTIATQYKLVRYSSKAQEAWDKLVSNSVNGTLLHTRKFLSYHGDKFDDQSLLVYDESDTLKAIFPAAVAPSNPTIIISHPGITYGGIIHDGWIRGNRSIDLFIELKNYYANASFKELIYKVVPLIYHRIPAQDDIYALVRLNAHLYRIDLSTTIDLQNRGPIAERRQRLLKKAIKSGLQISTDFENITAYWEILAANLKDRYNKKPVHSIAELLTLKDKFPDHISLVTAMLDNKVEAGSLTFDCPTLIHAQYFASSTLGRETGALDLVIESCIEQAKKIGRRYFDFGTSTEEQGTYLNDSLHTYKCEFGGCASVYEFYKLKLVKDDVNAY